jgi:hypothetical protein
LGTNGVRALIRAIGLAATCSEESGSRVVSTSAERIAKDIKLVGHI